MGIQVTTRRKFGRAPVGARPRKIVPCARSKNIFISAAMSRDGLYYFSEFRSDFNTENPHLTPTEEIFSKWKNAVKAQNCANESELMASVLECSHEITPEDCRNSYNRMEVFLVVNASFFRIKKLGMTFEVRRRRNTAEVFNKYNHKS
ncbi:hypothetical protein HELRODRAFT_160303 [Helobdella robusta]|uniref:Uncharacterized protein n=1 Tax=Helobdella robusta TaxID=6412 RepID=T1EQ27_HELRO|nr:hypothetical protein HELRODRAFT_160303 [Helobdella robusta]ESO06154.1 hypothetical protein HELRODRAFT_160303 [Helobdella robusta]